MLSWLVSRIIPYDSEYPLTDGKYFSCNGDIFWTKNGKLHREDGPAFISFCMTGYYINGNLHREDGPAKIYTGPHSKLKKMEWYINGEPHREYGPALIDELSGFEVWMQYGKAHRIDGPAFIDYTGEFRHVFKKGHEDWYINDHRVTDEIHKWAKDRDIDLDNLSEIDKMVIKLEWGNYGK